MISKNTYPVLLQCRDSFSNTCKAVLFRDYILTFYSIKEDLDAKVNQHDWKRLEATPVALLALQTSPIILLPKWHLDKSLY